MKFENRVKVKMKAASITLFLSLDHPKVEMFFISPTNPPDFLIDTYLKAFWSYIS
ncbi:MAG: hypothetical protein FD155_2634 [Bacteroidetes bacterium]|nr:MAG: hypothetical protein FD155_2634 [Bacteroidota bacterium]